MPDMHLPVETDDSSDYDDRSDRVEHEPVEIMSGNVFEQELDRKVKLSFKAIAR